MIVEVFILVWVYRKCSQDGKPKGGSEQEKSPGEQDPNRLGQEDEEARLLDEEAQRGVPPDEKRPEERLWMFTISRSSSSWEGGRQLCYMQNGGSGRRCKGVGRGMQRARRRQTHNEFESTDTQRVAFPRILWYS